MDAVSTLLDRELLLSGLVHELRGAITAVHGYAELDASPPRAALEAAIDRMSGLVSTMAEPVAAPSARVQLLGEWVRVSGPPEALERAIALLPHASLTVEARGDIVCVEIEGVPATEQAPGWSAAQVSRWLAQGGPGLAGARLRIAARIVGALRCSFPIAWGENEGTITIHLSRG